MTQLKDFAVVITQEEYGDMIGYKLYDYTYSRVIKHQSDQMLESYRSPNVRRAEVLLREIFVAMLAG